MIKVFVEDDSGNDRLVDVAELFAAAGVTVTGTPLSELSAENAELRQVIDKIDIARGRLITENIMLRNSLGLPLEPKRPGAKATDDSNDWMPDEVTQADMDAYQATQLNMVDYRHLWNENAKLKRYNDDLFRHSEELSAENADLLATNIRLTADAQRLTKEVATLKAQLADRDARIDDLAGRNISLATRITASGELITTLKAQGAELRSVVEDKDNRIEELLAQVGDKAYLDEIEANAELRKSLFDCQQVYGAAIEENKRLTTELTDAIKATHEWRFFVGKISLIVDEALS